MPTYPYHCSACLRTWDAVHRVAERYAESCCGRPAVLEIAAAQIQGELRPYDDDGLGVRIETRQQRKALMRAKGLEEVGGSGRHGTKGTIFSFPGRPTESVPPSGAYLRK